MNCDAVNVPIACVNWSPIPPNNLAGNMKLATPSKSETSLLAPFVGLPLARIAVPASSEQFAAASAAIQRARVVGFDTESKPTFAKGEVSSGPHIVQFATQHEAFIFQLHQPDGRACLIEILQSAEIIKVGFGLASDRVQILEKLNVELVGARDLDAKFRDLGYRGSAGVRAAVAIVLNQKFHKSKRVSTSNWSRPQLAANQLLYAANDAFAALMVYQALTINFSMNTLNGSSP